ncbi:hypothetical protein OLMES_4263 [Oleiphilus messinensis]|uniref:DUF2797 domain-containing protein n=1 Tax=Oleiphilus messinensis TaxID=141451 RepID=A0A1Y0ICM3_9GAMM|nr:DUF2797 domain-containing protein [Oleiphilus messinensis]ARU58278.1 hypothetical protein OLMES_4263 [Oleiphilus messinensis]
MEKLFSGSLAKMKAKLDNPVHYSLDTDEATLNLNELIGQPISLQYQGNIACCACGRATKKSFAQGFCYPCFTRLAACDTCIMSPEKCHFAAGTCREPDWGTANCMVDHIVYLANSSGLKVGITRHTQVPTRWIDQGATQALPMFRVSSRYLSGRVEVIFKDVVTDRTNWRAMLKGNADQLDMHEARNELVEQVQDKIAALDSETDGEIQFLDKADVVNIQYPVEVWPTKVTSFNFDKTPTVEGTLQGIKGQYLILDTGCLNIRKFTSYAIDLLA